MWSVDCAGHWRSQDGGTGCQQRAKSSKNTGTGSFLACRRKHTRRKDACNSDSRFSTLSARASSEQKHDGQRGPFLACGPYKAFNMPKRLSTVASCDCECTCSTVSCSVGAASMTGSGGSAPRSQISTDAVGSSTDFVSLLFLVLYFEEIWLHGAEETAFIVVCACFFVHCGVPDRGHGQMPPPLFTDLWAHHGRITIRGDPLDQTWSE